MSPAKATDFPLLLEVFRDGLEYGVISKDEIVAWADQIIAEQDEPDYFFIEISLSVDKNSLFEILGDHVTISEGTIPSRVILGVTYKKLVDNEISLEKAISILNGINSNAWIISYERSNIYVLDDEYDEIIYQKNEKYSIELTESTLRFLAYYKDFILSNYSEWPEINASVENVLKVDKAKSDAAIEASNKAWKRRAAKRKLKRYALFGLPTLIVIGIILINCKKMQDEPTISQMFLDHENLFFLDVFGFYFTLRVVYMVWKKKRLLH